MAASQGRWTILTFHGINQGHLTVADVDFRELCAHLHRHRERLWTAPIVNVSYGGLAFRARRSDKWPPRGKGEIVRLPLERRSIRIRALHSVALPGGVVRVGCAYV